MKKSHILALGFAVVFVLGIAVIWATGSDVHNRRIKACIAASDKFAQILEEEASKPVETRDLVRMEEARIEWVKAFKINMADHYAPDEVTKNPAFDAAFIRHQTESVRARRRLDKALQDADPEYANQMEAKIKQWLQKKH
jgi:hypothetical protein